MGAESSNSANRYTSAAGDRAFTFVELIVVLVIIAIGLCVLVPFIQQQREKDRRSRCVSAKRVLCGGPHLRRC
jgi:prepilin-type N-terminal cleavage/methylation domain-containing protein